MRLQLKRLLAIDMLSLILFALALPGIPTFLPRITEIIVLTLFAAVTILLTVCFMRRRMIGMVAIKIAMLFSAYFINAAFYLYDI